MGEHNLPNHIDHPVHYTQGIECIDYINSHHMDYLEGNIIKYITRYRLKGGVDDLRKAEVYLKWLIKREALGPAVAQAPDNYWPSVEECSKPLRLLDHPWNLDKDIDLDKEKQAEVARETAEAKAEHSCKESCDNYIKPHFPATAEWPYVESAKCR
jgi:hypothetical protein